MSPSLSLATASAEETKDVGAVLGSLLVPGDVVSLTGDLGAGKTTLVQGAAATLGVDQPVLSPTFTLVREYGGRLPVFHMDVYRLDRLQEVLDLGFDEMLDGGGVVFIEWGDAIDVLLPEAHVQVELTLGGEVLERRLHLTAGGESWERRWPRLERDLAPWTAETAPGRASGRAAPRES